MSDYYDYLFYIPAISGLIILILSPVIYFKITRKLDRHIYISIPMPIIIEQLARNQVYCVYIAFHHKKYYDPGTGQQYEFDFNSNTTLFDKIISVINTLNMFVFIVFHKLSRFTGSIISCRQYFRLECLRMMPAKSCIALNTEIIL